jgi:hypothetical protein
LFQYNLIQLGAVFITDDNTDSGDRAISRVSNIHHLYNDFYGNSDRHADGSEIDQISDIVDLPMDIEFNWMYIDKLDAIKAVLAQWYSDGLRFDVEIAGEMGTFTGTGKFSLREGAPIEFGTTYFTNKVNDVTVRISFTPDA